ncbi:MAG: class I SAM-dependent methyltransferase [Proteobacteria bacterium]|nr:class I SAM-dependent methyltransferase [Pseudomonadota bacterium]MBU0964836.1 class I SAM-dependent methyltransferase [Pseudomonadota bacterium]
MAVERTQDQHFDEILSDYEAHYDDRYSQIYRQKFLYAPLFAGINFKGMNVLEAMCGSGQTTAYLLGEGAHVTGLDISPQSAARFSQRWPSCRGIASSILQTDFEDNTFDCVVIIGGLHHVPQSLEIVTKEICRILKPGGFFCFGEPHRGSFFDLIRRFWYRHDTLFTDSEEAIDIGALQKTNSARFRVLKEIYTGNIAYLLVLNSLIFRVSLSFKKIYSPSLFILEKMLAPFSGKITTCFALCQWQKVEESD